MTDSEQHIVPDKLRRPNWIEEFEQKVGRPLRVLNLGNIANNGFQNAKIMRRAGIDADCIAYDYYHVMGMAEWEDATFHGNLGDSFYPDWWRVRFENYARPDWFIQGPKDKCISYIKAKHAASESNISEETTRSRLKEEKSRAWQRLEKARHEFSFEYSAESKRESATSSAPARLLRRLQFRAFTFKQYRQHPFLFRETFESQINAFVDFGRMISAIFLFPFLLIGFLFQRLAVLTGRLFRTYTVHEKSDRLEVIRAKRELRIRNLKNLVRPFFITIAGVIARLVRRTTGKRFGEIFGDEIANHLTRTIGVRRANPLYDRKLDNPDIIRERVEKRREARRNRRTAESTFAAPEEDTKVMQESIDAEKEKQAHQSYLNALLDSFLFFQDTAHPDRDWVRLHLQYFGTIDPEDLRDDLSVARALTKEWNGVFELYDIVIGYSTDGILPMAGSKLPYYTYEHGTLRSIPFEDTVIGRLCATSYRACNSLMITNLDTISKPALLNMSPDQTVYLPHAVDDKKLLGFRALHADITPTDHKRPMIFHPSRHDWGDGDPSLTKGNDKFLIAVKTLYDEGFDMNVVLLDWGRHVQKSKELIKELGIEAVCHWQKPMKKTELWKTYFRSHAIADQFSLPAFGGITFEALTFSKRVLSWIDEQQCQTFFGENPPLINCWTSELIADGLRMVLLDPEDKSGIGQQAGEWARKYHSSQRILDLQLERFEDTINASLIHDMDGDFVEYRPLTRKISEL